MGGLTDRADGERIKWIDGQDGWMDEYMCRASAEDLLTSPNPAQLLLRIGYRLRLLGGPCARLSDHVHERGSSS